MNSRVAPAWDEERAPVHGAHQPMEVLNEMYIGRRASEPAEMRRRTLAWQLGLPASRHHIRSEIGAGDVHPPVCKLHEFYQLPPVSLSSPWHVEHRAK